MKVLLGVSGGIAAYKAADLTSHLVKAGAQLRVVLTPSALHFIGPLTFEALSGHPVMVDTFATGGAPGGVSAVEHIAWAKWADVAVLAPTTASTLGKLANGIADNALLTVWLALPGDVPQLICPAMNTAMWEHPAVQDSLHTLERHGRYTVVAPVAKRLACGDVGVGGLAEVPDIVAAVLAARPPGASTGR
ncbi:MAG: phosphopantothenoylcysteine decarboxylase/phosphopantothenate--cysteine ligase [Myxococcota bacterium]|jgi:phosphopantothenoylcysteine decarboxylase/phosphopantothenate--cysteine ligase